MKVKWSVEGAGCRFAQCGLPDFEIEIEDGELVGLDETGRRNWIDERVQEEFDRTVYPFWEIVS